ncbi:MAG: hypothetical protein LH660_11595 [Phormidesmis sp. CAN_BIN36]|nr:hypothetical protein [Phormidesmis sp. CAN_BIN36]
MLMNELAKASSYPSKQSVGRNDWQSYLLLGLVANASIWGLSLLFLNVAKPVFTSQWAVSLPASRSSSSVNLPQIGGGSSQVSSPFDNKTQDPRENYKFIITSESVLAEAAKQLNMSAQKFGEPRVKIVDSSTLMIFEVKGSNPQESKDKSIALYQAFEAKLVQLRQQEAIEKNQGIKAALKDSQQNLETTQERLSSYKARSGLVSSGQIDQLSNAIEDLRKQRAVVLADQQQAGARLKQLSANLNVSAPQAAEAFALNSDQLFLRNLQDYSTATAETGILSARLGPNHPAIVQQRMKQEAARAAMLDRSRSLLGRAVEPATLAQLNIGSSTNDVKTGSARDTLFQEVVTAQVAEQGFRASAATLDRQISLLEEKLRTLAQYGSTLDGLKRDMQISEAVFSSTLGSLNLGKAELFGSYPQVQLVSDPSLPETPSSPKKSLVLLGAALGSILVSSGIAGLWLLMHKKSASRRASPADLNAYSDRPLTSDSRPPRAIDL